MQINVYWTGDPQKFYLDLTSALRVKELLADVVITIRPTPGWSDPSGKVDTASIKRALEKWGEVQGENEPRINLDIGDFDD